MRTSKKSPSSLVALLSLLLLIATTTTIAHAQTSTTTFTSTLLNGTLLSVSPPPLINATQLEAANDNTDFVRFGFPMRFGSDMIFSGAFLTTNGEMQFGDAFPLYAANNPMPWTSRAPVLAFFYSDMYPLLNAERSYVTTGTYPNRVFTLRWLNVPYASTASSSSAPPSVTLDVLIFEVDYHIEVRYYTIMSSAQSVVIGLQLSNFARIDGSYDFTPLVNNRAVDASVTTLLTNTTWVLTQTNTTRLPEIKPSYGMSRTAPTPASIAPSSAPEFTTLPLSGSNGLDTMHTVATPFPLSFYGVNYSTIYISPHGFVQFANPQYDLTTSTTLTPWPGGLRGSAPVIAVFQAYLTLTTLVAPFALQHGTFGAAPSRIFVVRHANLTLTSGVGVMSTDLLFYEATNAIEMRYYDVPTSTKTPVQIGMIGAQTARADGTYDMAVFSNAVPPEADLARDLKSASIVFTPGADTIVAVLPDSYQLSVSTLATGNAVPPMPGGGAATSLSPFDDSSDAVPLGFFFTFYGVPYSFVNISSEGFLQFSSSQSRTTPMQLPLASSESTSLPLFAFFWTPLLVVPSLSSWMYSTTGAYPNRVFTLRLLNVVYASEWPNTTATVATTTVTSPGTVSLDMCLYEFDSLITVSYYNVSVSTPAATAPQQQQQVVIGMQASTTRRYDLTFDYTTFVNLVPLGSVLVSALNGRMLTFTPTTPVPPPAPLAPFPVTYMGTYNATHTLGVAPRLVLTNATWPPASASILQTVFPLGFAFTFFNVTYTQVRVSGYGNIQFATASPSFTINPIPASSSAITPAIMFMFTRLSPGQGMVGYQTLGVAPRRIFVLRFVSVPWFNDAALRRSISVDTILSEFDFSIEIRYYSIARGSSLMVNIGVEDKVPSGSLPDYVAVLNRQYVDAAMAARLSFSTVRIQRVVPMQTYLPATYSITRRPGVTLERLPSSRFIEGSNDNIDKVPIGFPFVFYNVTYATLQVSSNGDIQFGTSNAIFSPRRMPLSSSTSSPYLAYFYTDLYPMDDNCKQYDSFGTYPNRIFVLRLMNVPYTSTQGDDAAPAVSIDVVLFEIDYRIEVRYHRVDASLQTVNVGVEGPNVVRDDGVVDYTTYLNQVALGTGVTAVLQNATLVFSPTQPFARYPYLAPSSYAYTRSSSGSVLPAPVDLSSGSTSLTFTTANVVSDPVPIGFTFTFFDTAYTQLRVSPNGFLTFRTDAPQASLAGAMPTENGLIMPAIAYAFADWDPYPSGGAVSSSAMYATLGVTAGSRVFVVRLLNYVWSRLMGLPSGTPPEISIDVLLYETSNDIRIRYYLLAASVAPVVIGVQASTNVRIDDTYDYLPINNYALLSATNVLNGSEYYIFKNGSVSDGSVEPPVVPLTYREAYVGAEFPRPSLAGAVTYSFNDSYSTAALPVIPVRPGFLLTFFGAQYGALQVSANGVISFMQQVPTASNYVLPAQLAAQLPVLAFAFTSMAAPPSPFASSITPQTLGDAPQRTLLIRFEGRYASNTASGVSVDVRFEEATGVISLSYYRLDITNQTMQIGLQATTTRRSDYTYDFLSTLNQGTVSSRVVALLLNRAVVYSPNAPITAPATPAPLTTLASGMYDISWSPNVASRVVLSSPSNIAVSQSGTTLVDLGGMTFPLYGVSYTSIRVAVDGNIQFNTSLSTSTPPVFPGTTVPTYVPFLAPFFVNLRITTLGQMQYQLVGAVGQPRFFVVRYNALPADSPTTQTITADILLYETTGVIEYRYYSIGLFSNVNTRVQIGIRGAGNEYASVYNFLTFGANGMSLLTMSTVTIRPSSGLLLSSSAASVPVVSSSVAIAASSAPLSASSSPLVSSSAPLSASSSPLVSSSAPLAASLSSSSLATAVDPLGCSAPTLPSSTPLSRVAIVLRSAVPSSLAGLVFPRLRALISTALGIDASSLYCGGHTALPATITASIPLLSIASPQQQQQQQESTVTVYIWVVASTVEAANEVATRIATAASNSQSALYKTVVNDFSLGTVASWDQQPSLADAVSSGCVSTSGSEFDNGCANTQSSSSSSSLSGGAIAGIVIAVVVASLFLIVAVVFLRTRAKRGGGRMDDGSVASPSSTGAGTVLPGSTAAATKGHARLEEESTTADAVEVELV